MRLDHLSVTTLRLNSYCHVNMKSTNLPGASDFDVGLMAMAGLESCLYASGVMLGRCMAIL